MDENKIWDSVLRKIRDDESVNLVSYEAWIMPTSLRKIDNDLKIAYVEVIRDNRNERTVDYIINSLKTRYYHVLQESIKSVMGEDYKIVIKSSDDYIKDDDTIKEIISNNTNPPQKKNSLKKMLDKQKIFNPKFNFSNFVVGPSNRIAHAAALAVAQSPFQAYNPLFIYGSSGLGKTHLMHAIGIYLLNENPNLNVLYVSSEMFTNELIKALGEHNMEEFKNKYRKVDVLLIDDIQFLEKKETTQEEFFHTFNTLYESNKQIIITSDRSPVNLIHLEERLRSRFQWNLIADIQPADYETRVAILLKKAENLKIEIDDELYEVICIIAETIKDNIRELEGAFIRIVSFSNLLHEKINRSFVKTILKDVIGNNENGITPQKIKKVVASYYGLKVSDIESSKKTNNIAFPRQMAMYLIRKMTDLSFPKIGEYFGKKHYTTVMYACNLIEGELKNDSTLRDIMYILEEKIKE